MTTPDQTFQLGWWNSNNRLRLFDDEKAERKEAVRKTEL